MSSGEIVLQIIKYGFVAGLWAWVWVMWRRYQAEKLENLRLREEIIEDQIERSSLDDLVKHNNESFGSDSGEGSGRS